MCEVQVWYDPKHELVYFHGLADTCLEPHLYVVSLRRPGEVRRLTAPGFSHSVEIGNNLEWKSVGTKLGKNKDKEKLVKKFLFTICMFF